MVRNPDDSWWLKLQRAERHLDEFKGMLREYDRCHPCDVSHEVDANGAHVYRVWNHERPDPRLAVTLGDFLFNLRSALDHMIVALVPNRRRSKASFPIFTQDIWERDETGAYLERQARAREAWHTATEGLDDLTLGYVDSIQPFRAGDPEDRALAILSRLHNADKHRQLIPVVAGLREVQLTISGPRTRSTRSTRTLQNGAVVARLPEEVEMKADAALQIGASAGGNWTYELPSLCETLLSEVGGAVLPTLDTFTPC